MYLNSVNLVTSVLTKYYFIAHWYFKTFSASERSDRARQKGILYVSEIIFQLLHISARYIILIFQVALCIRFLEYYVSLTSFTTLQVFMGFHIFTANGT